MGKSLTGKELGKGISQRKDGRYQARKELNGIKICLYDFNLRKLKTDFKSECNKIEAKINNTYCVDYMYIKFSELYTEFKKTDKYINFSTYTKSKKNGIFEYIIKSFGDKKIYELTETEINKIINITKISRNITTAWNVQQLFRDLFKFAYTKKYIKDKININLINIDKRGNEVIEIFSDSDISLILNEIKKEQLKNMTLMMLYTGMRIGEILGLSLSNIDLKKNVIYIKSQIVSITENGKTIRKIDKPKTKKSIRTIPISNECKEIILKQIEDRKKYIKNNEWSDILFLNVHGNPYHSMNIRKSYNRIYNKISNKLSVSQIRPHMFRHKFATTLLDNNVHTRVIQALLGHEKDDITNLYAHVTLSNLQSSIMCIDSITYKSV